MEFCYFKLCCLEHLYTDTFLYGCAAVLMMNSAEVSGRVSVCVRPSPHKTWAFGQVQIHFSAFVPHIKDGHHDSHCSDEKAGG